MFGNLCHPNPPLVNCLGLYLEFTWGQRLQQDVLELFPWASSPLQAETETPKRKCNV